MQFLEFARDACLLASVCWLSGPGATDSLEVAAISLASHSLKIAGTSESCARLSSTSSSCFSISSVFA